MSWKSLCRPGWPLIHRSPPASTGIRGMHCHHHPANLCVLNQLVGRHTLSALSIPFATECSLLVRMWYPSSGEWSCFPTRSALASFLLSAVCLWSPRLGIDRHCLQRGSLAALHHLQPALGGTDGPRCPVSPLPGHPTVDRRHSVCRCGLLQTLPCGKERIPCILCGRRFLRAGRPLEN